jgi:trigger factor
MYIKRFSQFVESEDKAELGDRASVKIEFSDAKNKKYNKEHTVVVSDDENESVYAKNSLGLKKGDSKELSSFLNDSEVKFTMTIAKIEKPDMKDDSSDEDKQKVKDSLKEHLEEKAKVKAETEFTNSSLYDSLVAAVSVDIPKGYLAEQIESALKELETSLLRQKTTMEDYMLAVGKKYSEIQEQYSDSIKKQITFDLIMAKIADVNKDGITVSEAKVQEYAEKMYQYQNYMGLTKTAFGFPTLLKLPQQIQRITIQRHTLVWFGTIVYLSFKKYLNENLLLKYKSMKSGKIKIACVLKAKDTP